MTAQTSEARTRAQRPVRHPHVRLKSRFGQWIVVMPETAFVLGGSGEPILRLCDGSRDVLEIARTIATESGIETEHERREISRAVQRFVERMQSLGVLVDADETETPGSSER